MTANHVAKNAQGVFERVDRVKQGLFVFLVVFVVGQGLAFHQCQQTHQVTNHTTCFATRELRHVGIFLLRHDGTAGGEAIRQFDKPKVLAHPQNQFFTQAADVHHTNAGSS